MFKYNPEKNIKLIKERGIGFDDVVFRIEHGGLLDVLEQPKVSKYNGQLMFVVNINNYAYVVPFVIEDNGDFFLKTVFPSRKMTKRYLSS